MSPLRRLAAAADAVPLPDAAADRLLLDHADPAVRRQAVLRSGAASDAVPDLLRRFAVETEADVREALVTRLAGHDTDAVADAMAAALRHPSAAVRRCAVEVLTATVRSTSTRLPVLLRDDDRDVRLLAVMVLAATTDPAAVDLLASAVHEDGDPTVVAAALGELVIRRGPAAAADAAVAAQRFPDDPYIAYAVDGRLPAAAGSRS